MSTGGSTNISTLLSFTSPFEKPAKYSSGKLNLKVTFKFSATPTVIDEWEKSFKRASKILFHATDGQLQFGNINYTVVSGWYTADALLFEGDGLSSTGDKMYLCGDERYSPFTIIHELGHYAFCLGDEYQIAGGAVGSAYCSNDASTGHCIMEHHHTDGDCFNPCTGELEDQEPFTNFVTRRITTLVNQSTNNKPGTAIRVGIRLRTPIHLPALPCQVLRASSVTSVTKRLPGPC